MVKHVVLMKAKATSSDADMDALLGRIAELKDIIEGIEDYSGGKDISGGARAQGYTHGVVMTLRDRAAMDAYYPHPAHQPVSKKVVEMSEKILAFDYEV